MGFSCKFWLGAAATAMLASLLDAEATRPQFDQQLQAAYNQMYDADFRAAERLVRSYRRLHPDDPMGPLSAAANDLFEQLHSLDVLKKDFFSNNGKVFGDRVQPAKPNLERSFEAALRQVHQLADAALKKSPNDTNAILASLLALTLRADYDALVKDNGWLALKEIKEATSDSHKLLSICSTCYDADLSSAVENYILGQQSGIDRFFLHLDGAETNETKGLEELRSIAENGMYFKPYARVLLAIAAVRQHDRAKAREIMSQLAREYPRNSFFQAALQSVS